ncbi:MAG: low temperature requirement protein A, partial [Myxococcales bacterium]|nr:low temperature requirement protein A [Myxococcales bacterium]
MRNRWFHPPKLHSPSPGNARRVGWLELFYDLIYVAAIVQLGNGLAHHVGLIGFLAFAGLFVPIWSTWTSFTFYSNRFVVDDFVHRAVVFAQMFGVAAMAVSVPEVFEGRPVPFAISYAFVRLTIVGLYLRTYLQTPEGRRMTRRNLLGFGGSALLWLAAIFVAAPWVYLLWGVALVIDFGVPLNRQSRAVTMEFPPDAMHISERYGLLTIIVLGESFVKVLSEVAASGLTPTLGAMGALALLVTFSLWWIYFDDVAGSRIKRGTLTPFVWVYAHLPLTLGVTAVGVAVKKAALMAPLDPGAGKSRWLLCGSLALTLFAVGVLDAVTERRHANVSDRPRFLVRLSSAVLVLLLAPTGRFMPAWAFVAIIALVCVAQVVLDLFLAPMTDPDEAHHEHQQLFADRRRPAPEPAPAAESPDPARPPRLRNP